MSKIKKVFRKSTVLQDAQADPEVQRWFGAAYKAIGSYFKERATGTGLSFEEQKLLLPGLIDMEPLDKDWRKTVQRFYDEISTSVPEGGLTLETGLEDDDLPLGPSNLPINIKEYVIWRHLLEHTEVAKNKQEADRSPLVQFYIHDPEMISAGNVELASLSDKALQVYFKYKDDEIKVDQILTLMGIRSEGVEPNAKALQFRSLAIPNPKENEYSQKETIKRFISIAEDKNKEIKFLIKELVGLQYLRQVGTQGYVFAETGVKIGDTLEEAVLFFLNAKNSRDLNLAKAQYVTKSKRVNKEALLPKEETPVIS